MNNTFNVCLDLKKIQSSSSTISNIQDQVSSRDILDPFIEIEEQIKDINFIHGNCITKYKEPITEIINKLTELKKEISELDSALRMTYTEFSKTEELDNNEIYNIVKLYPNPEMEEKINNILATNPTIKSTNSSLLFEQSQRTPTQPSFIQKNISTLANDINGSVKTISPVETEEPAKTEINTVPIGLGIAATGITGAVGAVVLDSISQPKHTHLETYREPIEYQTPKEEPIIKNITETPQDSAEILEEQEPYQAHRDLKQLDKYYSDDEPREENEDL